MAKTGRRPKEIDEDIVFKLAAIDCTMTEIAAVVDCDPKTLANRFSEIIAKGKEHGKMSLRRKCYETAMNGNVTMMIWLSKQRLGYREPKQELETRVIDDTQLKITELTDQLIKISKPECSQT